MSSIAHPQLPSNNILIAVGACTIHWSILENCIDLMVAVTFHRFGGNEVRKDLPRMFSVKTEYLKKVFRVSPRLALLRDAAIDGIEKAEALSKRRHLLTHGSPREYGPDWMAYTWLKVTPTMHMLEQHTITLDEVREIATEAINISLPLANIAERLAMSLDGGAKS
ncbi:hypothetical protein GCM10007859_28100 [Brevundimonas denitrificans]|uniref:Uncharacterized protein n=1 Tax=Brevundimonas denitrificans TaxID=1443434 RepID=A0ABQ6BMU6_9CAUL|nr:hypothetical protein [Brevundimonas denitrificans]GLS02779.1 hypothetical protein GCM10007859_28100 [Brevundimonas denitrificans]